MGASAKPETPAAKPGTPIPSAASPSPATPQTTPSPAPATSVQPAAAAGAGVPQEELERLRRLAETQEQVIKDLYRNNTQLEQRQREINSRVEKIENPPPSQDSVNKEFWSNPVGVMRNLISEEVARTTKPLNEQFALSAYDRLKAATKSQYADVWDKIEKDVDAFVATAQAQGVQLTPDLVNIAALTQIGVLYKNGGLPTGAPAGGQPAVNTPPAREPVSFTPPHLPPSAPSIPGREPEKPALRALTENEERLRREYGMTHERFLAWMETPPSAVVTMKRGGQ